MISQAMVARTHSLAFLMLLLCAAENPSSDIVSTSCTISSYVWDQKGPNQVDCFLTIFCTWKVCSCTFNTICFILHNFFLNSLFTLDQPSRKCYLTTLWIAAIGPSETPLAFTVELPFSSPKEMWILSFPRHWRPSSPSTSSTTFLSLLVWCQHSLWQIKRRAVGVWLCQHLANS